jgi:hypothetical protein
MPRNSRDKEWVHSGYVLLLSLLELQRVRKESLSPQHVYACAVSQLPRYLLGRFLFLQYLAAVN